MLTMKSTKTEKGYSMDTIHHATANHWRKHPHGLSSGQQALLDIYDFTHRPAKQGYVIIDNLLQYAYYPEAIGQVLYRVGEADFYNMPYQKGYVMGFNGILYKARLDRMALDSEVPKGYRGYFLVADKAQHGWIDSIWRKIVG